MCNGFRGEEGSEEWGKVWSQQFPDDLLTLCEGVCVGVMRCRINLRETVDPEISSVVEAGLLLGFFQYAADIRF